MATIEYDRQPKTIDFEERTRGPQGERGSSGGNAVLDALSYPQRKLKEAISGSEEVWGVDREIPRPSVLGIAPGRREENFEPEPISVSAQETALDFGLEPLDWLTGGLGKAGSVAANVAGIVKGSQKGRQTASFSNYVDNYYGLSNDFKDITQAELDSIANVVSLAKGELPEDIRTLPGVQKILDKVAARVGPKAEEFDKLDPRQKQMALEKFKGLGNTLLDGIKRSGRDFFNVKDAAMWKQFGINESTQEIMRGHIEGAGKRWRDKAVAQGQYLNHILRQSGREGNIHPAVQAIADASNLHDYSKNADGVVEGWLKGYEAVDEAGNAVRMSDADAAFVAKHMNNVTGNPDLMVMKRPQQSTTGLHQYDVLGSRNNGYRTVRNSFSDVLASGQEMTEEALGEALRKNAKGQGIKVTPAEGGGYWVSNGTNASAITEGGINSLIKVTTDGQVMGFMSDRHDWLEKSMGAVSEMINKVPGVDLNVENTILENSLAAVSPPMYGNLYTKGPVQKAAAKGKAGSSPETAAYEDALQRWEADKADIKAQNKEAAQANKGKKKGDPSRIPTQKMPPKPQKPKKHTVDTSDVPTGRENWVKGTGNVLHPFDHSEVDKMLDDVLNIKPTNAAMASEYLKRGGMMSGAAAAGNRVFGEDAPRTAGQLPVGLMNPEEQEKQAYLRQNLQGNVWGKNAKPFYS